MKFGVSVWFQLITYRSNTAADKIQHGGGGHLEFSLKSNLRIGFSY